MWLTVSLVNLLFITGLRLSQKAFVDHTHMNPFRINWLAFLPGIPIFGYIIAKDFTVVQHLQPVFWLASAAVILGFYPIVNFVFFRVISQNELSSILPLLGLIPIFTALFGWILLGQVPSVIAILGIICVSASIYVLYEKTGGGTWYEPIKALGSSGAARAMLVISLITAAAAIGDKYAINHSTASIYLAVNSGGAFIVFLLCDLALVVNKIDRRLRREITDLATKGWWLLIFLGITQIATQISGFVAVDITTNTSYTVAIRNLSIVAASLAAIFLLNERFSRYKILSYALSAAGVVLIAL